MSLRWSFSPHSCLVQAKSPETPPGVPLKGPHPSPTAAEPLRPSGKPLYINSAAIAENSVWASGPIGSAPRRIPTVGVAPLPPQITQLVSHEQGWLPQTICWVLVRRWEMNTGETIKNCPLQCPCFPSKAGTISSPTSLSFLSLYS